MPQLWNLYDNNLPDDAGWVAAVNTTPTPPIVSFADDQETARAYTEANAISLLTTLNTGQPAGRYGRRRDK